MSRVEVYYLSGKVEYFNVESAVISHGCLVLTTGRYSGKKFIFLTSI
jgi:hypothetical protein